MSRVFVVQDTLIRDETGELVSPFDLSQAERFGEMVYLVPPRPQRGSPTYYRNMGEMLADFSDEDYILPTGAREYVAAAGALAARANGGRFKILRWERRGLRHSSAMGDEGDGPGYRVVPVSLW